MGQDNYYFRIYFRIFFCKLLEKLEIKEIPGVNYKPKTMAACLVNIRKAYSILKNKASMKHKYLNDEELIYKGRRDIILEFL